MKRSIDRILATHQGTLPRDAGLRELVLAREAGKPHDAAKLDTRLQTVVREMKLPAFRFSGTAPLVVIALLLSLAPLCTWAQDRFPSRPLLMTVPFPPGGATDIIARTLGQELQKHLGQSVIFEYKPGAGGIIATEFVGKAPADGYTLGMVTTAHMINPGLRKNLPYDTLRDFSGVSMVAVSHIILAATPGLPANNLAEVLALARKAPGKLAFSSAGTGGGMHLAGELLKFMAGVDILHVPYKGGAAAYPDVMTGRIQLIFDPVVGIASHIRSGKIKAIAMASPKRAAAYPDIPSIGETVPGYSSMSITGLVVRRATPRELVNRLSGDVRRSLDAPDLKARMSDAGMEPAPTTPELFDETIRIEAEKWTKVIQQAGIKAD